MQGGSDRHFVASREDGGDDIEQQPHGEEQQRMLECHPPGGEETEEQRDQHDGGAEEIGGFIAPQRGDQLVHVDNCFA